MTKTAKRRTQPRVRTTVNYGSCELFSSFEMRCPLCGLLIPPNTAHTCKNPRVPGSKALEHELPRLRGSRRG